MASDLVVPGRMFAKTVNGYTKHMLDAYGVPVRYVTDKYGGLSVYNADGGFVEVDIGVKAVVENRSIVDKFLGRADIDSFVGMVWCMNHEERHVQQNRAFRGKDYGYRFDNVEFMAKSDVANRNMYEYYGTMYFSDPCEIDAELYALRRTCEFLETDFFKTEFPNFDVDSCLVNFINDVGVHPDWVIDRPVTSVSDCFVRLQEVLSSSTHPVVKGGFAKTCHSALGEVLGDAYKSGPSDMMSMFSRRFDKMDAFNKCSTQEEQCDLVARFIYEKRPEAFAGYVVLEDWVKNVQHELRRFDDEYGVDKSSDFGFG